MSEVELHVTQQRLRQGLLAKARRGALRLVPPMGYVARSSGEIVLDPDEQVQGVIRLVFRKFAELGTVHALLRSQTPAGACVDAFVSAQALTDLEPAAPDLSLAAQPAIGRPSAVRGSAPHCPDLAASDPAPRTAASTTRAGWSGCRRVVVGRSRPPSGDAPSDAVSLVASGRPARPARTARPAPLDRLGRSRRGGALAGTPVAPGGRGHPPALAGGGAAAGEHDRCRSCWVTKQPKGGTRCAPKQRRSGRMGPRGPRRSRAAPAWTRPPGSPGWTRTPRAVLPIRSTTPPRGTSRPS